MNELAKEREEINKQMENLKERSTSLLMKEQEIREQEQLAKHEEMMKQKEKALANRFMELKSLKKVFPNDKGLNEKFITYNKLLTQYKEAKSNLSDQENSKLIRELGTHYKSAIGDLANKLRGIILIRDPNATEGIRTIPIENTMNLDVIINFHKKIEILNKKIKKLEGKKA